MATKITNFALTHGGMIVAVHSDGRVFQQEPRGTNTSGKYDCDFCPVSTDGVAGKIVQVGAKFNGRLVALTSSGQLFEQHREPTDAVGRYRWKPIDPPAEPGS
jgi:hypothetical protein